MTAHSNGAAVKAAGRDSALTWEVPPPLDDPQLQGRLPDIQRNFLEVARKHVDKLVVELLAAERVANAGDWAPLLSDLAHRAAALLSPTALRAAGNTDPRSYIKVKRVGASRAAAAVDSPLCPTGTVVDGVVCRKALAHKRMRTAIDNPRIVTLRGDLEYERPNDKLSSFDALMDSERQHLRSIVNALVAVQTDVLLVDGSVARVAQEMLLEAGVSLATHVKPALLTRIARCVGATVLPATAAVSAMSVGTCAAFEVTAAAEVEPGEGTAAAAAAASPRHEPSSSLEDAAVESVMSQPAVAPLMWFKGCSRGLGCTVIVEGTNAEQLAQAKRAATLAAYAAYWNRIEAAYLADQAVAAAACEGTSLHGHGGQLSTAPAISAAKTAERREREGTGPIFSASPYVSLYKEPQQHEGAVELAGGSAVPTFADAQSLWLSISCRNPAKGIQCEPPHLHSMPYYREGDLPLVDFLAAAAPTNRKCLHPHCKDGAGLHLRSLVHGNSLVTLSSFRLAPGKELEGNGSNGNGTVWLWLRPLGVASGTTPAPPSRRIALSPEASNMSFAHLLALMLDGRDLQAGGVDLQHSFVRYLGCGNAVICLHHTRVVPYTVCLPPPVVSIAAEEQARWLQEELRALVEEADEVFAAIDEILGQPTVHLAEGAAAECREIAAACRASFVKMVHKVQTGPANEVEVVPVVNKLRRYLMLVAQQWDAFLAKQGSLQIAPPQPTPGEEQQGREQALAPLYARSDSVGSSASGSVALGRVSAPMAEAQSRPVPPGGLSGYLAPKLVDTGYDSPTEASSKGDLIIPTGLVAKYVAMFEDPVLSSKDSGAHVHLSGPEESGDAKFNFLSRPSTTIDLRHTSLDDVAVQMMSPRSSALPEHLDEKLEQLANKLQGLRVQAASGEEPAVASSNEHGALQVPPSQKLVKGRPLLPGGPDQPPVTIFDHEPTSLIAYFLSTRQYQEYVRQASLSCLEDTSQEADSVPENGFETQDASPEDQRVLASSLQLDCQMLAEDVPATLPSQRAKFAMTAYYAPQFAAVRRIFVRGGEAAYLASIARCRPWLAQGGKSNVFFAKTRDDRYVVKQLTRTEKQSILEFAPDYFRYMMRTGGSTCLCKILGVYQVSLEGSKANSKDATMDIMVMENLFHDCSVDAIYDLKGSERDRYVPSDGAKGAVEPKVLLDENLRELNQASPTLISPLAFGRLQKSLYEDTNFLASLGVMDYSLLVGFNKSKRELMVGLVDYARQYTWDKQVESWVKQSGLLGGAGKEPTIISPRQYARRFRTAMLSYFTVVPSLGHPPRSEGDDVDT